ELERRQTIRQGGVLGGPRRLALLESGECGVVDLRRRAGDVLGAGAVSTDEDHKEHGCEGDRTECREAVEHPRRPALSADRRHALWLRIAPLRCLDRPRRQGGTRFLRQGRLDGSQSFGGSGGWLFRSGSSILRVLTQGGRSNGIPGQAAWTR